MWDMITSARLMCRMKGFSRGLVANPAGQGCCDALAALLSSSQSACKQLLTMPAVGVKVSIVEPVEGISFQKSPVLGSRKPCSDKPSLFLTLHSEKYLTGIRLAPV